MAKDAIRYDRLVEGALRGVVRDVLAQVAEHGLPGNHHLYITFRTSHPEVEISGTLLNRYPEEMTIVLQHQFWELAVEDSLFRITLSFNKAPEALVVPFAAISTFADPSVQFGLQFQGPRDAADAEAEAPATDSRATETPHEANDGEPAEVITLDSFRKK